MFRLNRRVVILGGLAGAVFLATLAAFVLVPSDSADPPAAGALLEGFAYERILAQLERDGWDVLTDSDADRLPDVLENYVFGSDPHAFSTTGNGIPDGWFARHGFDPTQPGVEALPAATPPADGLPDAYAGDWPDAYRWSLKDVYSHAVPPDWPSETYWDNNVDPREWAATPEGIPRAWLFYHGMRLNDSEISEERLAGDSFTVLDDYEHDTSPTLADTDADGLADANEALVYRTDPRVYSSGGTGVPDGWLVRHRMDPLDPLAGSRDAAGKGMTVAETWAYNRARFGEEEALAGAGVDPNVMSHRNSGIPDGWLVGHGFDPLEDGIAERQMQCSADHTELRRLVDEELPEGIDPLPDLCLRMIDLYTYRRPAHWSEPVHGPWPGGLDPASGDQDGDGLPDVIEIRGRYIQRTMDLGPEARAAWTQVRSDPRNADSDGDGLTDSEEYVGRATRDEVAYEFPPSDPSSPDSAFSGMTDAEKVFGRFADRQWKLHVMTDAGAQRPLLDPTRRDTAGSYMSDGEAIRFWMNASRNAADDVAYGGPAGVYPGSRYDTYLEWMNQLEWLEGKQLTSAEAAQVLAPDGDADGDGLINLVDPSAAGDGLLTGWKAFPETLEFSPYASTHPRQRLDPANSDTSGDGLPDGWELRHGRWSEVLNGGRGGWDLDAARWDSDGDGKSDAEGNIDGDIVVWSSYREGSRTTSEWEFTNLLEFQAGTNPRLRDENLDGVDEGWVVFWASNRFYDRWAADAHAGDESARDRVGDQIPTVVQIQAIRPQIADPLRAGIGTRVKDTLEYYRVVVEPSAAADNSLLDAAGDEEFVPGWPQVVKVERSGGQESLRIAMIRGTFRHTHAQDQAWGLNPYLDDTSGEGIRDAWDSFYASRCNVQPANPAAARDDADGDGLTNLQEFAIGLAGRQAASGNLTKAGDFSTNPCEGDTDLDGLTDADEILVLDLNPLNPADAASSAGEVADSDGDELPDFAEVREGTAPLDPDTDHDGLLDGLTLPQRGDISEGLIAKLKALGIAHWTESCPRGLICFLGEKSTPGASSKNWQSLSLGVPDGWSAYYQQSRGDGEIRKAYACGKPVWWDHARLGTWWWGLTPEDVPAQGSVICPIDRDRDGLNDNNGEDPVPGASQANQAGVVLQDLLAETSIPAVAVLQSAQAWGECAGNPRPCFERWEAEWGSEVRPRFSPVGVRDLSAGPNLTSRLQKEQTFNLSGRVILCPGGVCPSPGDEVGAPNRTIAIRLVLPASGANRINYGLYDKDHLNGTTLGVGFTNETGHFNVSACLCAADGAVSIPAEGIAALGRDQGIATWTRSAADVPLGTEWRVGVHVYATTSAFAAGAGDAAHPQRVVVDGVARATESAWAQLDRVVHVNSTTNLSIEAPEQLAWIEGERTYTATFRLRDASGGPILNRTISFVAVLPSTTERGSLSTNSQGVATLVLPLGTHKGNLSIDAWYGGEPAIAVGPSSASSLTLLQSPLSLHPDRDRLIQRIGDELAVRVTVRSHGRPVPDIAVVATIADQEVTAITGDEGTVTLNIVLTSIPPGAAQLRIRTLPLPQYASTQVVVPVSIVTGSHLAVEAPDQAHAGDVLAVRGRLTLDDGRSPVANAAIRVQMEGWLLANLTTRADGTFSGVVRIPANFSIGAYVLHFSYAGIEDAVAETTVTAPLHIVVGTSLAVRDARAGRGGPAVIEGTLTNANNHPLVGEHVVVALPWNESAAALVRGGGRFRFEIHVPASQPLGVHHINVSYNGSPNGTFAPTSAEAELLVQAPVRIDLDPLDILLRGNNTATGRVVDVETGEGLANAALEAALPWEQGVPVATDLDGRFRVAIQIPPLRAAGPLNLTVGFGGTERYISAESSATGVLRVTTRLVISAPAEIGRGTSHTIKATLLDDRGVGVPRQPIELMMPGLTMRELTETDGSVIAELDVAEDAALGPTVLAASFVGDLAHDASRAERPALVKDGVRIRVDPIHDVQAGQPVHVGVWIEDTAGIPVQNAILIEVEGLPGVIVTETDASGHAVAAFTAVGDITDVAVTVRFPGNDQLAARTETVLATVAIEQPAGFRFPPPFVIVAAVAGVVLGAACARFYRARSRAATQPTAVLEDAQRRIRAGDPWAAVVLLAYKRLRDHLRDRGLNESATETSRSFGQAMVDAGILDEDAAVELVALFERAQYAPDVMSPEDANQAQAVLRIAIRAADRARSAAAKGGSSA